MEERLYEEVAIALGTIIREGLPEDIVQEISNRLEDEYTIENVTTMLKGIGQDIIDLAL